MAKNKSTSETVETSTNGSKRSLSAGMVSVSRDFPFYHQGSALNLKGYLVDCVDMPPKKGGEGWQALVFIATAPTEGVLRDGEVIDIAVGERVAIAASAALLGLVGTARNPNEVRIVELFHTGKINLDNGKTFNTFEIGVEPEAYSRNIEALATVARPMNAMAAHSEAPALPAAASAN